MRFLLLLALALTIGCQTEVPANYSAIKITASGPAGPIHGLLEANTPPTAGMSKRGVSWECPGSLELKSGPSEYKLYLDEFPQNINLQVYVNGKELQRGTDCTWSGAAHTTAELIFSVN